MFLPEKIKAALEKSSLYLTIRYSKWMHGLWLFVRDDVRKERSEKEAFYNTILPRNCNLIFDIGANEGALTDLFNKHSKKVIAVEPSVRNIAILRARFRDRKAVVIVPKAVSDTTGVQPWYEDRKDYAMGTLSRKWNDSKEVKASDAIKIETTTLDNVIAEYGIPDYIKIDVEGHERQVLQGLSQTVSLLSFEAILPQFLEETITCIQQLRSFNPQLRFNYIVDNKFAYDDYVMVEELLHDIIYVQQTIDIFCK